MVLIAQSVFHLEQRQTDKVMEATKLTIRCRRLCGWHGVITTASVTAATVIMIMTIPFNGLFSRTTWVSQYEMGKTSLDLNEASDDCFF